MKRLLFIGLLVLGGFYIAWPAYSAYQLAMGLKNADQTVITNKVAWDPLRDRLRPVFAAKVEKELGRAAGGAGGLLEGGALKNLAPQLVDKMLKTYVTPQGLTQLAKSGGNIDVGDLNLGSLLGGAGDKAGGGDSGGGLLGNLIKKAGKIAAAVPGGKEKLSQLTKKTLGSKNKDQKTGSNEEGTSLLKYGFDNIKSFRMISPLEFEIGVANDPKASEADLTAGMGFSNFDWKLTKFVPKI